MKRLLLVLIAFFAMSSIAMAAVNLNSATKEELEAVKGIGPAKAKAIIDYRKKNGSFKSVGDLKNVSGFGDKSVANIRSELSVGGAAPAQAGKKADAKPTAKVDAKAATKPDTQKIDKPAKK